MKLMEKANRTISKLLLSFFVFTVVIFGGVFGTISAANAACGANEIDVLGDGTQCETTKFSLTTTSLSANDTFQFSLSATGTFYVDCGDGGTLSGTGVSGNTITRTGTTETTYTCTYSTAGTKTINFGGTATNYNTDTSTAAISFYQESDSSSAKIASISGNLSSMFPYISGNAASGAQPRFYMTFRNAKIRSIPETLFANYTTGSTYMFNATFYLCSSLVSIPDDLFGNIITGAAYMFYRTFYGCSGLTSIPGNLFFPNATSVSGQTYMFGYTFYNCTGLRSIPADLFSKITSAATYMFYYTFGYCRLLTSIPENLFSGITKGASSMFRYTFTNCTSLTKIPENLFSGITTVANYMFYYTFYNCASLSGYIPKSTFAGLIANGSPKANYMWGATFTNTQLAKTCPIGTTEYNTGYKGTYSYSNGKWGDYVSCEQSSTVAVTLDNTNVDTPAQPSTIYLNYMNGWYSDSNAMNAITSITPPIKSGYTFGGYYTEQNGDGTLVVDPSGNFVMNAPQLINAILYPHFFTSEQTSKFTINTTNLKANDTFGFSMSAEGIFWVDCGDGGTLSGDDVSGNIITRTRIANKMYTCTYSTAGTKTIKFGGTATNYSTVVETAAISFYQSSNNSAAKIASISGNLSSMFPYMTGFSAYGAQPRFYMTFYGAKITSIPETLFANYTTGSTYMFNATFYICKSLTTIPENLFFPNATSVSGAEQMFRSTFYGCSGLTSIPADLFSKITTSANYMFYYTFHGCTGLTSIPENLFFPNATSVSGAEAMFYYTFDGCTGLTSIPAGLFSKITTGAASLFKYTFYGCKGLTSIPENLFFPNATSVSGAESMFYYTFGGCTGLTSIPVGLFSKVTTGAISMFSVTFYGCTGLTSIPENLFFPNATSVNGQSQMFRSTFIGCTGLTSIPAGLFSKITTGAANLFRYTFANCTSVSGYIPPSTFSGLIANGSPTSSDMWSDTFTNTQLATSCTGYQDKVQYITGYEDRWGGKVSCETGAVCPAGKYLPANTLQCTSCPENTYCAGGTLYFDENVDQGIQSCASGLYSPVGMWESAQCGRVLHIGDNVIYLRSTPKTSPALRIDIDNDGEPDFFGNVTTADVPMTRGTTRKLKVNYNNTTYSIYDDTVDIGN